LELGSLNSDSVIPKIVKDGTTIYFESVVFITATFILSQK
jgi:hypothetical protein